MGRFAGRASRRGWWLIAILLLGLLLCYAWTELTRIRGAQTIAFAPARQVCGAAGRLRYCVYRDRAGTNGDIVYYLQAEISMSAAGTTTRISPRCCGIACWILEPLRRDGVVQPSTRSRWPVSKSAASSATMRSATTSGGLTLAGSSPG